MQENHYLIPTQLLGKEKDIAHSIYTNTTEDAEDWFVDAKERLLDINNWRKYSGSGGVDFKLTDSRGKVLNRKAHNGDHVRITVTPGIATFDWVVIEALEYDDYPDTDMETFAMRVRPGNDPAIKFDDPAVYDATSTIVIERKGRRLTASYHGRNESVTGDSDVVFEPGNTTDNISWLGLSDTEWANLVKGLID